MRKILLLLMLLFSLSMISQSINVNTTTYTVNQLVKDILVNKPCVPVTNITYRTGSNFGSTNGIGYFTNTNPNFPLQSGVILSTGNVQNASGPNTSQLNDGNAAWVGDVNLEATLLAAGITMVSTNATVLEFDFTPFSANFNFQFLFASEEYGNYQCQFSDSFAFLLTDNSTGTTTNLAVVPGTNIPISVQTIREIAYNSSCPSANSGFFGAFNGGSNASVSATNFNGQTIPMDASAVLIPDGRTYHIKLVIADRLDNKSDSAVFLASNSFNVGQNVLGSDLTIATNTAVCQNSNYTILSGLDPTKFSFVWTQNGTVLPETGPDLVINQAGTYGLNYTIVSSNCVVTTDYKEIEYYTNLVTPNPIELSKCDLNLPNYTFDLSLNTPIVFVPSTPALPLQVSYHLLKTDAEQNTGVLPLNYNVLATNLPKTVWIRIKNTTTGCVDTKSFVLSLIPPPTISPSPLPDYKLCESDTGVGTAAFDLTLYSNTIIGAQTANSYLISYHTSQNEADSGLNPIVANAFTSGSTTVYVRLQNKTEQNCYVTSSIPLVVIPLPALQSFPNQYVCTGFVLPHLNIGNYFTGTQGSGTALFEGDIITVDSEIFIYYATTSTPSCKAETHFKVDVVTILELAPSDVPDAHCDSYTLPGLIPGAKYFPAAGGPSVTNIEIPAGTVVTTPLSNYNIYFVSTDIPSCTLESNFILAINPTPIIAGTFNTVFDCLSYTLPTLPIGNYYTKNLVSGIYTPAVSPITTSTKLYVFAISNGCRTTDVTFDVFIGTLGVLDINQCNPYTLPSAPVGEYRSAPNGGGVLILPGLITQTTRIYTYVPGQNCTNNLFFTVSISGPFLNTPSDVIQCSRYSLPPNPDGGTYYKLAGGPTTVGNQILTTLTQNTTVFVYKASAIAGCFSEKSFNVTINQKPLIDSRADVEQCSSYTLTPILNGNYFDNPNGQNPLAVGTVISSTNRIYIFAANSVDSSCFSENFFDISIIGVQTDPIPNPLVYCNSFRLPVLTADNFYYTQSGGPHTPGNTIIPANTLINTSTTNPIYIFKENISRLTCSDEKSFNITINNSPVITPAVQSIIKVCNSYTLQPLTTGKYFSQPNGAGVEIIAPITYTSTQPTIYAFAENAATPSCPVDTPIDISIFNVVELIDVKSCQSYTLPNLPVGQKYYRQSVGVDPLPSNVISSSQTVFIYGLSGYSPNCSDESDVVITIVPKPIANNPNPLTKCDTDALNDGITSTFNLSDAEATILGSQTPAADFTFSYFASSIAANNPTAIPVLNMFGYTNIIPYSDSVWVRITNNTLTDPCFEVVELKLNVSPFPNPILKPQYAICEDFETGALLNPTLLDPGVVGNNYSFEWTLNGVSLATNVPVLNANFVGNYTVQVTNTVTNCVSNIITTDVVKFAPIVTVITSNPFESNPMITVIVSGTGSGNYEYQLDDGIFQESNLFNNVSGGLHQINVRDKDGKCSPAPKNAFIINYPKFFTPNGDGYNDTWNILDLKDLNPNAPINIFDRFGKLLEQITPNTTNWDGNHTGNPLPASDYWFTVDYLEKGILKTFKSHFALKR